MIYIVRHGQTDYNVEGRYGGRIDVNLNEKGINQALEIKNNLQGKKFDVVISSPLSRAITTAKIIIGETYPLCKKRSKGYRLSKFLF